MNTVFFFRIFLINGIKEGLGSSPGFVSITNSIIRHIAAFGESTSVMYSGNVSDDYFQES